VLLLFFPDCFRGGKWLRKYGGAVEVCYLRGVRAREVGRRAKREKRGYDDLLQRWETIIVERVRTWWYIQFNIQDIYATTPHHPLPFSAGGKSTSGFLFNRLNPSSLSSLESVNPFLTAYFSLISSTVPIKILFITGLYCPCNLG